jgi:hypothetical protein
LDSLRSKRRQPDVFSERLEWALGSFMALFAPLDVPVELFPTQSSAAGDMEWNKLATRDETLDRSPRAVQVLGGFVDGEERRHPRVVG